MSLYQHHSPEPRGSPPKSESDDELDLDELDPRELPSSSVSYATASSKLKETARSAGNAIALHKLYSNSTYRPNRTQPKYRPGDEDSQELLGIANGEIDSGKGKHGNSDQQDSWMVGSGRRGRRRQQHEDGTAYVPGFGERMSSFRASMSLPGFVGQELDDMQEDVEVDNSKSREVAV